LVLDLFIDCSAQSFSGQGAANQSDLGLFKELSVVMMLELLALILAIKPSMAVYLAVRVVFIDSMRRSRSACWVVRSVSLVFRSVARVASKPELPT